MFRFYQLDAWTLLGSTRLTWRRFAVLVRNLPRESVTSKAMHGDDARWGDMEHLLALIADHLQVANLQRRAAHFKGRPPKFRPVERPGSAHMAKAVPPGEIFKRMIGKG